MNALIDLEKCREYITVSIGCKDHQVKLSGTVDDPYFCHNEVCAVLGYKDPKDALKRYVDKDDKINYQNLTKKLVGAAPTNFLGQINHNLSYHEGKASYISETGLYSLILSSQAPFAKEFKKLVCKTILPSIRKYGSYQVEKLLKIF